MYYSLATARWRIATVPLRIADRWSALFAHKKLSDALVDIAQYEGTINQAVPVSGITDVQFMELPIERADNHGGKNTATMTIGRMTVTIDESISDSFLQRIMKAGANV